LWYDFLQPPLETKTRRHLLLLTSAFFGFLAGCDDDDKRCTSDYSCWTSDDHDEDGYDACVDCDDKNAAVNPGVHELCGDGIDNDCNDRTDTEDAEACPTPGEPSGKPSRTEPASRPRPHPGTTEPASQPRPTQVRIERGRPGEAKD